MRSQSINSQVSNRKPGNDNSDMTKVLQTQDSMKSLHKGKSMLQGTGASSLMHHIRNIDQQVEKPVVVGK